jgi:plastocyanin
MRAVRPEPLGEWLRRAALRLTAAAATGGLALAAGIGPSLPARAAGVTTTATGGYCGGNLGWTQSNIQVNVGDSVTWQDCGTAGSGNHTLQSTSSGWCLQNGMVAQQQPWTNPYTCTFNTPGTYSFQCGIHGSSMAGSVTVAQPRSAPPSSQPSTQPTHSSAPPPASPHPATAPRAASPTPVRAAAGSSSPSIRSSGSPSSRSSGAGAVALGGASPSAPAEVAQGGGGVDAGSTGARSGSGSGGGIPAWGWVLGAVALAGLGGGGVRYLRRR